MEKVRHIRKMRGLSQEALAQLAGVTQYTVSEIELGHRDPHPSTLRKLATALNVELAEFFRESADWKKELALKIESQAPNHEDKLTIDEIYELADAFDSIYGEGGTYLVDELAKIRERRNQCFAQHHDPPDKDLGSYYHARDRFRLKELEIVARMAADRLEELGDQEVAPIVRGCLPEEEEG